MPRLDRLLSLYCFSPLRKIRPAKTLSIPILMYHSISNREERDVHPYFRTCTSPRRFMQQISWLHEHGYMTIHLTEAANLLSGKVVASSEARDKKYVVITFDDGFMDFYTDAFPILSRYGFTASIFLPTSFIKDVHTNIMDQTFLSWPQVRELIKAGITFGSHTVSHKYLDRLSRHEGEQELQQSKETIEDRTGSAVYAFSFPYAFPENDRDFVSFMRSTLQACGYSCAVTTRIGTAARSDDLFSLKRIPVNGEDDLLLLQAKMAGGYDWLHTVQFTAKSIRELLGMRRSLEQWPSR